MKSLLKTGVVASCLFFSSIAMSAEKVLVFAAASLTNAMQDIGKLYEEQHPDTTVTFSFASSSVLARQIEQGAPADIFMSADQKWMNYLLERDIATDKSTLLKNSLVLIAPKDSKLDNVTINNATDWTTILPKTEKMAVGDPDHVPAGLYAKEALTNLGQYDKIKDQFVRASNVRDALSFVEQSEAALGIVYSTDAKVSKNVKIVGEFPSDSYTPVEYPITLLNDSKASREFYQYLFTPPAKQIFEKYGFVTQ